MAKKTVQNRTRFKWTKPKQDAAALLAADELTDDEIAARVNVARITLWSWRQHPDFSSRVEELARELGDAARRYAIARRLRRLQGYDDRRRRMLALIEARAAEHADAPGGETGLIVRTQKSIGSGPAAQIVEEYAVDAALLKELRELEKQAAVEAGQWTEKREYSVPDIDAAIERQLERLAGGGQAEAAGTPPADAGPGRSRAARTR